MRTHPSGRRATLLRHATGLAAGGAARETGLLHGREVAVIRAEESPQRKHLPLRVRLWIDYLKHHYGDGSYWRQAVG